MTNGNQSTTNQEPSLADLQNQLALLQAQLGVQQAQWQLSTAPLTAQLELFQKLLPQGQTAPPAGTITTTGDMFGYAAGISLAYEVIEGELVDKLIAQLEADFVGTLNENDGDMTKVLIVDTLQYAPDDLPLAEVTESIESFKVNVQGQRDKIAGVREELGPAEAEALSAALLGIAAVPSIINTLAGVAGHFQGTYGVTGQKFDVPTEGLLAAVASKLGKKVKVCISNFYTIGESALLESYMELQDEGRNLKTERDELANQIAKPLNDQIAVLNQQIRELESQRSTLDSATKQPEIDEIKRDIEELKQEVKPIQDRADKANAAIQASNAILDELANFQRAVTTSADGKPTKLAQAMLRNKVYQAGITHILFLKTIFSGGHAIAEERRLRSDKISYQGETGLSFLLATLDGNVVSSGLLRGMRTRTHRL